MGDKKVREQADAKNIFDGYLHAMQSFAEGSVDYKGQSEKLLDKEKERIMEALKAGRSWLDSNPDADVDEIKDKQKEVEETCAPIISKYNQGGDGIGAGEDEE